MLPSALLETASSMVEVLRARADTTPDSLAFSFLTDGEEEGPRLTYADLDLQAHAIASTLRENAEAGDRALLLYAPGLEFIPAFFGCLYAGVVPVPSYPPRLDRLLQSWQALGNIARDCQPKVVLTTRNVAALFGGSAAVPHLGALPWICTDDLDSSRALSWREPRIDPDALALLQYTSGSTAAPKGVMVTHRNLMHNQRLLQTVWEYSGHGPIVCWLPLYHDMGLLGGVLVSVFRGVPAILMSPLGMLQRPLRWLQAISRHSGYGSGGPNFAYDLCLQRIPPEQRAGLDLSNWSMAAIGSEPIRAATMERFTEAFAPHGFRPETFYPCYGLAEATLFVTGVTLKERPVIRTVDGNALEQGRVLEASADAAHARKLVGCGRPWLDTRVVIAHPEEQTLCPAGSVGEIWVAGPSVAAGYWGRPEETERTFRAFLKDSGEGPFLRTGDLGFLQDGELFVTGRLKDLIVLRGRNHYPQDLEQTVQSVHPGLREGGGAAFETSKDGQPRLVIVQEVERRSRDLDPARLLGDVRKAVADHHELHVHDLVLLEPGSLPKTSSGKVQRHRCRLDYEQGTLRHWKRLKS